MSGEVSPVLYFPSIVPSVNRCYSLVSTAEEGRAGCAILLLKRNRRRRQSVHRQNFNTTLGGGENVKQRGKVIDETKGRCSLR